MMLSLCLFRFNANANTSGPVCVHTLVAGWNWINGQVAAAHASDYFHLNYYCLLFNVGSVLQRATLNVCVCVCVNMIIANSGNARNTWKPERKKQTTYFSGIGCGFLQPNFLFLLINWTVEWISVGSLFSLSFEFSIAIRQMTTMSDSLTNSHTFSGDFPCQK